MHTEGASERDAVALPFVKRIALSVCMHMRVGRGSISKVGGAGALAESPRRPPAVSAKHGGSRGAGGSKLARGQGKLARGQGDAASARGKKAYVRGFQGGRCVRGAAAGAVAPA